MNGTNLIGKKNISDSISTLEDFFAVYGSLYQPEEKEKITAAWQFLDKKAGTTLRDCGSPFMNHPMRIMVILASLKMDSDTIAAGILHNALEFDGIFIEDIERVVGSTVAQIVRGTSRISGLRIQNKTLQQADAVRKMLFAMIDDIRTIIVKLADRLDRIRNMKSLPAEKQRAIAQEIIDIWAPLANRLGISSIKAELEDMSLKYINPEAFQHIKHIVAQKKDERSQFLESAVQEIKNAAAEAGITNIKISSRAKHFWSIYQKMKRRNKSAEELFDLFAMRILCSTETECYTLLGMVHRIWKPLDGRFKDYIAMPKANGYRSLHTTVMTDEGKPLEIQIRTYEMHAVAEHGVASHWLYKKGTNHDSVQVQDLSLMVQLRELTKIRINDEEFLQQIKDELLKDSIFVFTPKGEVIELPAGSTAIDFAYMIHSAVGEKIAGAKADGQIIPLSEPLRNTQVIEVLTSQSAHPTINQLRIVTTSKARSKIKAWLLQNDETAALFEKTPAVPKKKPEEETKHVHHQGDGLHVEQTQHDPQPVKIRIGMENNFMISIAKCCTPGKNDPIVGYVSRGRGIVVHHADCPNLGRIPEINQRMVQVVWDSAARPGEYTITVESDATAEVRASVLKAVKDRRLTIVSDTFAVAEQSHTGNAEHEIRNIIVKGEKRVIKNTISVIRSFKGVTSAKLS